MNIKLVGSTPKPPISENDWVSNHNIKVRIGTNISQSASTISF